MRFQLFQFLLLFATVSISQQELLDSIAKGDSRIVYDNDFRDFEIDVSFNKLGKVKKPSYADLDSLIHYLNIHNLCICELKIDDFNKASFEINEKRINKVLDILSEKIDTNKIAIQIYRQHDKKPGFDNIFGPDLEYINSVQNIVTVAINCKKTFYLRFESKPFTGYHIWTDNGTIKQLTYYIEGKIHGYSHRWGYNNQQITTKYNMGNLIKK